MDAGPAGGRAPPSTRRFFFFEDRHPNRSRLLGIGERPPPVPSTDTGQSVQFRVLARWESAKPVRLAGGPELPEGTAQFYVIRLQ